VRGVVWVMWGGEDEEEEEEEEEYFDRLAVVEKHA